jgi:hypothetical protein
VDCILTPEEYLSRIRNSQHCYVIIAHLHFASTCQKIIKLSIHFLARENRLMPKKINKAIRGLNQNAQRTSYLTVEGEDLIDTQKVEVYYPDKATATTTWKGELIEVTTSKKYGIAKLKVSENKEAQKHPPRQNENVTVVVVGGDTTPDVKTDIYND